MSRDRCARVSFFNLIAGGIALWTGQRQGDLLCAGDQIRLRQSKTGLGRCAGPEP